MSIKGNVDSMKADKEFQPFLNEKDAGRKPKYSSKQTIIKSNSINMRSSVKIEVEDPDSQNKCNGSIEPILEHGEIVGIIYRCSCGKVAETRFEYMKTGES